MGASETFDWFVNSQLVRKTPELEKFIVEQRDYLLTLRSEDEAQRFVDWVIEEIRGRLLLRQ